MRERETKRKRRREDKGKERKRGAWRTNVVETHFDVFSFPRKLKEKQAFQAIYAFTGEVSQPLRAETY